MRETLVSPSTTASGEPILDVWIDVLLEGARRTGAEKKLSLRDLKHMADAIREKLQAAPHSDSVGEE